MTQFDNTDYRISTQNYDYRELLQVLIRENGKIFARLFRQNFSTWHIGRVEIKPGLGSDKAD